MSSSSCSCPSIYGISIAVAHIETTGGDCYDFIDVLTHTDILINCNISGICPDCEFQLNLLVQFGPYSQTLTVGGDGLYIASFDDILTFACSTYAVTFQIRKDLSADPACTLPDECPATTVYFKTPGLCSNSGECEEFSESGGSSGSTGSDTSSSDSEGSGSPKGGNVSDSMGSGST